ncbi:MULTISPECIES: DUF3466 family protein [Pseudoalteromonas]|jgi:hypothetical protein|uniref:DUF3466 family protein n=1 Tax=Pseudoalteromonas TaxID=53246 RepID=UPI000C4A9C26|nr:MULTISPECIES: DUF3466 family protein [unclassified Pseudoalteromonas]MBU76255.1 hypothetical protein [Pseudoalteromonadaceae bacterium]HCV01995.1 hypothetical protein [Pseudoalteromonas sp.]MCF2919772.1 DUF3466 family protein [Pseudoalteromonas sp. APAL1]MCO7249286.1 DUF3466 family protein [Pseudoalteromonas sp. Ps84H-4]TMO44482.1 hypothetical protein CWC25_09160 [Pseudoalteromonas sp. S4389]|tara:strand:- start:3783 stop:5525 length:1743 start_codon:yes stop_codon:yes gene_type:complete
MKYKLLAASILATLSTSAMSATYKLEELGGLEGSKHNYITDVSENGHIIGLANGTYKLPVDVSYIDFDASNIKNAYDREKARFESIDKEITFTLDDIQNNDAVNTNADAHAFMIWFLSTDSRPNDSEYQKISSAIATTYTAEGSQEQVLFDEASLDYDGLTRSTSNLLSAVADDGVMVGWGSAPYEKTAFTQTDETEEETHFLRDFISRGIVIGANGVEVPLVPEFDEHGGISAAYDIVKTNSGYEVVGTVSTGIPVDPQDDIDDRCDNEDEPVSDCVETLNRSFSTGIFDKRAVKWTLDNDLNIINTEIFGLGLTPKDDEDFAFRSSAFVINENGVIAGTSDVRYKDRDIRITMPVIFENGEVKEFLDQEDDWTSGQPLAINNDDVVVGYATKRIEGTNRTKFFYYDKKSDSVVFPTDYFSSSSSIANDINDNGVIVGEGETDIYNTSTRRREGFMYTIGEDKVVNLNDLLPCYEEDGETRFKYVVAEAKSINNNNEIFGVATKTVEKTDSFGNTVVDLNGNVEYESIAVPVKLTPISGSIEECPAEEVEQYERQSASFPWYALILLPFAAARRFFKAK